MLLRKYVGERLKTRFCSMPFAVLFWNNITFNLLICNCSLPWLSCQFPVARADRSSVQHVSAAVEAPRGRSSHAGRRRLAGNRRQWFDPSLCRTSFSRESYSSYLRLDCRPLRRRCLHQGLCRPWRIAPHLRTCLLKLIMSMSALTLKHHLLD